MTESTGERPPSGGRTPMDVLSPPKSPTVFVTPPDMTYVVDQLKGTCGADAGSSPPRTSAALLT